VAVSLAVGAVVFAEAVPMAEALTRFFLLLLAVPTVATVTGLLVFSFGMWYAKSGKIDCSGGNGGL